MLHKFKDNMKKDRDNFDKKSNNYLDIFDNKISILNDKISKIKDTIKNNNTLTNAEKNELQNKIIELTTQRDSLNNEHRRAVDKMLELKKEKKLYEELKKEVENFFDLTNKEIKYDFDKGFDNGLIMVLIKMVFIKILVKIMILMVLIAMVFTLIPMVNMIVKVLI